MKSRINISLIVLGFSVFIIILSGCSEKDNNDNDSLAADKNLHAVDTFKKGVELGLFTFEEDDDRKIPDKRIVDCMKHRLKSKSYPYAFCFVERSINLCTTVLQSLAS